MNSMKNVLLASLNLVVDTDLHGVSAYHLLVNKNCPVLLVSVCYLYTAVYFFRASTNHTLIRILQCMNLPSKLILRGTCVYRINFYRTAGNFDGRKI